MEAQVDVLIVDPSDEQAEITAQGVRRAAATARTVRHKTGDEALRFIFRRGPLRDCAVLVPRLILLELELPVMNGLYVLDLLRKDPSTKDVPVVLLTSILNPFSVESSYALGASAYIVKPEDPDRYVAKVSDIVERWLPPQLLSRTAAAQTCLAPN